MGVSNAKRYTMKKILVLIFVAFTSTQCDDDNNGTCSTYATVKDLTGFDGCGFVFELEDGTRLEPLRFLRCGTGSPDSSALKKQDEDPLLGFEFIDEKRVRISYEVTENLSACIVGPVVKITCIQEMPISTED
jgi:hypothetical protein